MCTSENVLIRCESGSRKSFVHLSIAGDAVKFMPGQEVRITLPVGETKMLATMVDGYFTRLFLPMWFFNKRREYANINIPDENTKVIINIIVERFAKRPEIHYVRSEDFPPEVIPENEKKVRRCSICGSRSIKFYGNNRTRMCVKCISFQRLLCHKKNDVASAAAASYFAGYIKRYPDRDVNGIIKNILQAARGNVSQSAERIIDDVI